MGSRKNLPGLPEKNRNVAHSDRAVTELNDKKDDFGYEKYRFANCSSSMNVTRLSLGSLNGILGAKFNARRISVVLS